MAEAARSPALQHVSRSSALPPAAKLRSLALSPVLHLQLLIVLAVLLGGGGVAYGLRNLFIQLFAIILLTSHARLVARFAVAAPVVLRVLVAGTLILPLLQLVPLPPQIWQALPGRETVITTYAIAGLDPERWLPASLDRARTLVAFTGLIAPVTIVVLGSMLPDKDRAKLCRTVVGSALAAMAWGVVQLQTTNSFGLLYPVTPKPDVLYATFANRNSTGLFLVIGALLAVALFRPHRMRMMAGPTIIALLLVIGTILTQSRSSMVLLGALLFLIVLRAVFHFARRRLAGRGPQGALLAALALTALGGLGLAAYSPLAGGRIAESVARFGETGTDRPDMWEDTLYATGQYWPAGSGFGTFDEVFQLHESLEHVSARRAGRAHSDWLEIGLEGGPFAYALALGWLAWATLLGWRHLRSSQSAQPSWLGVAAAGGAWCIALQSLLDYPLRNQTLLCVAAVLAVTLLLPRSGARE